MKSPTQSKTFKAVKFGFHQAKTIKAAPKPSKPKVKSVKPKSPKPVKPKPAKSKSPYYVVVNGEGWGYKNSMTETCIRYSEIGAVIETGNKHQNIRDKQIFGNIMPKGKGRLHPFLDHVCYNNPLSAIANKFEFGKYVEVEILGEIVAPDDEFDLFGRKHETGMFITNKVKIVRFIDESEMRMLCVNWLIANTKHIGGNELRDISDSLITDNNPQYGFAAVNASGSLATVKGKSSLAVANADSSFFLSSIALAHGCRSWAISPPYNSISITTGEDAERASSNKAMAVGKQSTAITTECNGSAIAMGRESFAIVASYGYASVQGEDSIAAALAPESCASGALGDWLILTKWGVLNSNQKYPWDLTIKDVKAVKVDGVTIKPGVVYYIDDAGEISAVNLDMSEENNASPR